jgi:hypothetical protein
MCCGSWIARQVSVCCCAGAASKPPGIPKAPGSLAERAKAAEAAFTARRVAALQKVQQK